MKGDDFLSEVEKLNENFNERGSLIIYLKSNKYVNKLKHYGYLQYVSRRMHYAILYVDKAKAESLKTKIEKEHFVKKVEISPKGSFDLTYDGLLEKMQEEIDQKYSEKTKDTLFY